MATATRTVEEVLRDGGFTRFHRKVVLITGFAWTFVAFEIILIGLALPVFGPEVGVGDSVTFGVVTSATLLGSFVGSILLGRYSDRHGRRTAFQVGILWYAVFTAITAASWDVPSLFAFRALAGVGLGALLVIDPSLLSEYLPPQSRGRFMVLLDFFWPVGFLLAIVLSYVFLVAYPGNWRLLFVVAAFPAFMAYLFRRTVPESAYYLARQGRLEEAADVLSRVTGRPVAPGEIAREQAVPRAPLIALFRGALARRSTVTVVVWIALNFSYYGLFLWLPNILAVFESVNLYVLLTISAVAQFPGYLTSMVLVEKIGRKRTLSVFLILGGVSGLIFATAQDAVTLVASLILVSFFNLGAWGAVYPYTSELFPTQYRATGFGLAEGVGKITAILAPVAFGLLLASSGHVLAPLVLIALFMGAGGLILAGIGPETKGEAFV
ncbi:MAG TPA: MFS transporter [Thermoplasmata archaeon]|nr:MFS transporter [Thermoplasmata archaeon]